MCRRRNYASYCHSLRRKEKALRAPETERIYSEFHKRKSALQPRLQSLQSQLVVTQRLNRAVKAGRVATIVIDILNAFEAAGLAEHFTVVKTHALYAYEAAAGVRIPSHKRHWLPRTLTYCGMRASAFASLQT